MDGKKLYPLTHPQQRIWFTEKLHPGTGMWNNAGTIKIKGPLDVGQLEKAVNHVIKFNEALRICITQIDGEPFQYVCKFECKRLEFFDFSHAGLSELYEWDGMQSQMHMPLLDRDLFYFAVLKISDQEWGLYAKVHHIISDAWSIVMICNQIMESYDRLLAGEDLQELQNGSYIAYLAKEQEYLASKRFAYDEAALGEIFAGLPEPTVLKQKRSNYTSTRARRKACILNKTITDQMRAYCEQKDSTIFALFLAGLCVYINRILGKDDIIIGVPVFNRTTPEDKNTVGMFVSTVPIRIKVKDDMDFDSFVETVSNEWFRVLKHQKYPYEYLLSNLRKENKNLDALYDITLSYQNARFEKHTHNFNYEGRWHFAGSQVNSLSIHINDREGEGRLILDYDHLAPLFSIKEIEYIHRHCETILQDALLHPEKKLYQLNIMPPEELDRVLYAFNANEIDYPQDRGLDALFREQASRTPEGVALIAGREVLTYRQLNNMVNKTAHDLQGRGVDRNSVVAVMIRRDYTLLVNLLAVIRAGGAFLPIDPEFPLDRMQYVLADSGAQFAIASPRVADKCGGVCEIIQADRFQSLPDYAEEIKINNFMSDLAYVIYTSGSTGKPKGVMIQQRSIVHFLFALSDIMDFSSGNTVLSWGNISFDIFIMEAFPTLINGGTLVLAGDTEYCMPQNLIPLILSTGINKILSTPARLQMFLSDKSAEECLRKLKEIMVGGDILPKKLLNELQQKTSAKIFNFYGPTEATIAATCKDLTNANTVNIGKPIANIHAYILDKHKNPVPIGTQGELYIGGIGVARGYLNRDDLTKKSFLTNPFIEGEPLYKTGDIARWFPMGEIEFIGREDQQVKIRGLRIELGEIENVIADFNGINKAVVVDYRKNDAHILCAYYTQNNTVDAAELRDYMRRFLPLYMIPSCFIPVEHFTMTPSGKVDKNVLQSPEAFIAHSQGRKTAKGMTVTQKKMAKVWKKVLKVKNVAAEDNFFELGGDSLSVLWVQNEMLKCGVEVSVQDFYAFQTLSAICRRIDDGMKNNESTGPATDISCVTQTDRGKYSSHQSEPLDKRILSGDLSRLDSAALTYIPDAFDIGSLERTGNTPVLYNYMDTGLGTTGVIALPIWGRTIYSEKNKLITLCMKGIQLAKELGAKTVSLTGLIPSATDYGLELAEICARECTGVQLTTGHTTTASSVILSLERLLRESGRTIINEDVCVLGLGSIGTTVVELLLSVLHHPASVTLCDIVQKSRYLDMLMQDLKEKHGYNMLLRAAYANGTVVPDEVYEASLIIGATNVPDLLDVGRLKPGTLIIDDSGPHCFSKEEAIARLKASGDILFTEGGVLQTPNPIIKTAYLPPFINENIMEFYHQHFLGKNEITGCILSGLLSAKYEQLKTVVGPVQIEECRKHYTMLKDLSFDGALLHCDDYIIPESAIEKFKKKAV